MKREYTVNTRNQVLMYLNSNLKPNEVTEASTIALNTWSWSDDLGFHYNVGSGVSSDLTFSLGKLNEGDLVDVYAEVYVLSGDAPQITFNEPGVKTLNYTSEKTKLQSGYNIIRLSSYNDAFAFRNITVGAKSAIIGEGYIRNVRVVVTPKRTSLPSIMLPIAIRNTGAGVFEEWKTASDNLSSVTVDTANNQLKLTFKKRIEELYYLRPIPTIGGDVNDNGVYWKFTAATFTDVIVKAYSRTDNTLIPINNVAPYTYGFFCLNFNPKDHDWLG